MNVEEINKLLFDDLKHLKSLSNREYIINRKYYEVQDFLEKQNENFIKSVKEQLVTYDDLKSINENSKFEVVFCNTKKKKDIWKILRIFCHVLHWSQNPGRNLKFIQYIDDKIVGITSIGSEIISIRCRDDYIGWNKENKFNHKRLNKITIGTTILPIQPFGFMMNGGKLIAISLYDKIVRTVWEELYKDKLVGATTTSLFGNKNSQYNGMPKFWKNLGETEGSMQIHPSERVYSLMRDYLRENYKEEYEKACKKSSPKRNVIGLYQKVSGFKEIWNEPIKNLSSNFKRGVYFAKFYENTLDYLRNEIDESELVERKLEDNLYKYWYNKFGKKRFEKKKNSDVECLFMDDRNISLNEFIEKYL